MARTWTSGDFAHVILKNASSSIAKSDMPFIIGDDLSTIVDLIEPDEQSAPGGACNSLTINLEVLWVVATERVVDADPGRDPS